LNTHQAQKADDEAVQSLRAGDDLQDHHLTEFARILAEKTRAGLAGKTRAACAARAREANSKTRAQHTDGAARRQFKDTHFLSSLRFFRFFCNLL
jgi:topoisomerase IA-like protein